MMSSCLVQIISGHQYQVDAEAVSLVKTKYLRDKIEMLRKRVAYVWCCLMNTTHANKNEPVEAQALN